MRFPFHFASCRPIFEGRDSSDFGPWWDDRSTLVGHSLYLGAMGPSKPDTYEPTSGAGRAASALNVRALVMDVALTPAYINSRALSVLLFSGLFITVDH